MFLRRGFDIRIFKKKRMLFDKSKHVLYYDTTFQLRVIRAFKSTLEDMEEKRSCHSMHSVRSTRSYLTRPTSDISYIDDDEKWKGKGSGVSSNGHYIRTQHGTSQQNTYAKPTVVDQSASNYLKVEGGAYRVQRSVSSGSGSLAAATTAGGGVGSGGSKKEGSTNIARTRSCNDAATQSCESSFTQTDESCLAPIVLGPPAAPPSPHPPVFIDSSGMEFGRVGSAMGYTRGTSPTPPYPYNPQVPTSCYHGPYPYDPNYYHTYLNPMVTAGMEQGYQYDIVVRRPSMGPTELSVPVPNPNNDQNFRRPSIGTFPVPPHHYAHPQQPHLAPHSLPGSFDSSQGPPVTPVYTPQPNQPLSPRHLHNTSTSPIAYTNATHPNNSSPTTTPIPPPTNIENSNPIIPNAPGESKPLPIPATEIPKLIHETSI